MDDSITTLRPATPDATGRKIIQRGPGIGAEVQGVDLANGLDDAATAFVRQALDDHSVIVLRDQHLSPAQQTAFTKRLGEMRVSFYNRYGVPGHPELSVVSNIKNEAGEAIGIADAGMLWHTDASYLKTPDMYTVLYGIEIPHRDGKPIGDTVFTSAWGAYEALPEQMKRRIAGLRATHSFIHHLDKKKRLGNLKRAPLTEAQKAELPDVDHPIVRTHPVNGRPCLFVTEGHTSAIVGLPEAESDALLEELWNHLKNPAFHYRHSWRAGDVIVWDNCAVHHLAVFDYGDIPRRLHRAGVLGPVPY
jgi:taurine dioxygenase